VDDQERSLIEAIRAEPEDDAVRLVYADWLEEHGQDDRAELIRVQLALMKDAVDQGLAREKDILARRTREWLGSLAGAGVGFWRGMARANWKSPEAYAAGSARLAEAGDPIWVVERRLKLGGWELPGGLGPIVAAPGYGRLTWLEVNVTEAIGVADARAVASSPASANLTALSLYRAELGTEGARELAQSPHLRRLRRLGLWLTKVEPDGIAALADSTTLEDLCDLNLSSAAASEEALAALVSARGLRRLARLNLGGNRIGDARLRKLLKAPWVGGLKALILVRNSIRDGGAKALADCPALADLEELLLNLNAIGDEGAQALLDSPHLRGLRELTLGFMKKITPPTRKKIEARFGRVGETGKGRADW
jgi:uncharacterized protein (TIGR02996 family)